MAFLAIFTSEFFMTTAWRWVINTVFGFVVNYGWRVILFTVCLKLLLYPIDFFNRKRSHDMQRVMRRIKPQMDQLEKKYANDPRELMMQKRALQKKYHVGGMGMTCLSTILTLFIFMTLWGGFTSISQDMNINAYKTLDNTFTASYHAAMDPGGTKSISQYNAEYWVYYVDTEYGASAEGKAAMKAFEDKYKEDHDKEKPTKELLDAERARLAKQKFFEDNRFHFDPSLTDADYRATYVYSTSQNEDGETIVTIKEADGNFDDTLGQYTIGHDIYRQAYRVARFTAREDVVLRYDTDVKESFLWVKNIWRADTWVSPIMSASEYTTLTKEPINGQVYNEVMSGVTDKYGTQWNGYLILVIATVVLNFLTQFIMMRQQKKSGEAAMGGNTMKIMMWVMPIILAFFAFQYASAFTVYMVTNSLMTLSLMGLSQLILKAHDKRMDKKEASGYISGDPTGTATRSVRVNKKPIPTKKGKNRR